MLDAERIRAINRDLGQRVSLDYVLLGGVGAANLDACQLLEEVLRLRRENTRLARELATMQDCGGLVSELATGLYKYDAGVLSCCLCDAGVVQPTNVVPADFQHGEECLMLRAQVALARLDKAKEAGVDHKPD